MDVRRAASVHKVLAERDYTLRLIITSIAPFVAGTLVAVLGGFVLLLWSNHRASRCSRTSARPACSVVCTWPGGCYRAATAESTQPYSLERHLHLVGIRHGDKFFMRYTGTANRWIEKIAVDGGAAGYLVLYAANTLDQFSNVSSLWRGFAMVVIAGALIHISIFAVRTRRREHRVAVGFLCVCFPGTFTIGGQGKPPAV